MSAKSKFFCVAVEGATTDGRVIERVWIQDMAATYSRPTYGARVNCEHIRGFTPEPPFNAYGDVLAVEAREIELSIGGKTEKKLALFAQIEPTDQLVAITGKSQKIYTSIEINPNFANTGKCYLMGLAVTDSPASLGTDILAFAASKPELKIFANRKQADTNLISAAQEATIEFETAPADAGRLLTPAGESSLFAMLGKFGMGGLFSGGAAAAAASSAAPAAAPAPVASPSAGAGQGAFTTDQLGQMGQLFTALAEDVRKTVAPIADQVATFKTDFDKLKADLEKTPGSSFTQRPAASGGAGQLLTDC